MLLGLTVPSHWPTVEAVLITLCDLARVDPDEPVSSYYRDDASSQREDLERAWHQALGHPDERNEPTSTVGQDRPLLIPYPAVIS